MHCGSGVGDAVLFYGHSASDRGNLNLSLLKVVDGTVDWLAGIQKDTAGAVDLGRSLLQKLQQCERTQPLDPDGEMRDVYLAGENKLRQVIEVLKAKRDAANRDRRILGHHFESLVSEFDAAIEAISQMHDLLVALRWAVSEHDADLEKPIGAATSSADELIKRLKA